MTFGSVMKEERKRRGLSRREAAAAMHIAESTLRAYESGRRQVPDDVACCAIRVLRSPRLQAQRCYECPANLMTPPWLDQVDCHPQVVRDKVLEELEEALTAVRDLALVNKRGPEDLTREDRDKLQRVIEEMLDLYPALMMWFAVLETDFGYDHEALAREMYRKLRNRGYVSYQPAPGLAA